MRLYGIQKKIFKFMVWWKLSWLKTVSIFICFRSKKKQPEVFYKKGVLKNFSKFSGKHLYLPMNFAKFLRTPFLQKTSGRLLMSKTGSAIF